MAGKDKPYQSKSLRLSNTKLIPRDLSESLGKLPPQNIEMEEAVLGAILLERGSLDKVPFLLADHFYKEAHAEIFRACLTLKEKGEPVDMRTVVNQLRKNAKLELIEGNGMYYIAELTKGVQSSANVETHARVIVEMAVKRATIQAASQIQHDAYDDTTDPFELLDKVEETIKHIKNTSLGQSPESRIKALWLTTLIDTKPADDRILISIYGTPVCSANNHSLITGKKKSRKTLFLIWVLTQAIASGTLRANEIILFDTEQGKSHVWRMREKIYRMTGFWVPIFYLRGMSPAERQAFIQDTVRYWKDRPAIAIIDGIRDLVSNINDPDECTDLIVWLEKLTLDHGLHVINVLHQNKTDTNARGHLGTELLNKAQTIIDLEIDPKTNVTMIKCEASRDKPFDPFAFTHGLDDLPEIVGMPVKGEIIPEDDAKHRLRLVFSEADGGKLSYKELLGLVQVNFSNPEAKRSIGKSRCETMIANWTKIGWIMKSGKPRDPTAKYTLMLGENNVPLTPLKEIVQTSIFNGNGHESPKSGTDQPASVPEPTLNDDGTNENGEFELF